MDIENLKNQIDLLFLDEHIDRYAFELLRTITDKSQALQLLHPDVIRSVCKCKEGKQGRTVDENWEQICTRCGGY